jgi:hypothetical protein
MQKKVKNKNRVKSKKCFMIIRIRVLPNILKISYVRGLLNLKKMLNPRG